MSVMEVTLTGAEEARGSAIWSTSLARLAGSRGAVFPLDPRWRRILVLARGGAGGAGRVGLRGRGGREALCAPYRADGMMIEIG